VSWGSGPHWTVSEVENNLALICACVPALRPVFGRLLKQSPSHKRPEEFDSLTLVSRSTPSPTIKSRHQVQYPSGATAVWFDLEGIASDEMAYTINLLPNGNISNSTSTIRGNRQRSREVFLGKNGRSPTDSGPTISNDSTGHIVQKEPSYAPEYYAEKIDAQEVEPWDPISKESKREPIARSTTSPVPVKPAQRPISRVRRLGEPPKHISREIAARTSSRRINPANPVNTSQMLPY